MKRPILILLIACLLIGCAHANENIEINNVEFELPSKYSNGELNNNSYKLDDDFSIRYIDNDVPQAIGLWASESENSQDLNINDHPVRHFCQYNEYVNGNQSHAYFVSGESVYEIAWTGEKIDADIEKLIKNTPPSEIDNDDFYDGLNACLDIYKKQRKDRLNKDGEYNYLEAKYNSQSPQQPKDDTRFREILYTYYLNR